MKITLVGAGSNSFGKGVIVDVLSSRDMAKKDTTLFLMDIDRAALEKMFRFAGLVKEYKRTPIKILAGTGYREALSDADYVITSVASKRLECWEQEFYIPLSFGFKHVLGENGGPDGFSYLEKPQFDDPNLQIDGKILSRYASAQFYQP